MYNTERLVLRAFRESDVQDITDMWNDPNVQRGLAADHVHPRPPKFAEEVCCIMPQYYIHSLKLGSAAGLGE